MPRSCLPLLLVVGLLTGLLAGWAQPVQCQPWPQTGSCAGAAVSEFMALPSSFKASGADCTVHSTNPTAEYDPGPLYEIALVVHLIEHADGRGRFTNSQVEGQIQRLREDLLAVPGSPGAGSVDLQIRPRLVAVTRTVNSGWFFEPTDDSCPYCEELGWDPSRFVNVYVNDLGSPLIGRFYAFPQDPQRAKTPKDRIVIDFQFFSGQDSTLTHEIGHYLGLYHTFSDGSLTQTGCGLTDPPGCYTTGDLVCDTAPDHNRHFTGSCQASTDCGNPAPTANFMGTGPESCWHEFTVEQRRRMRCALSLYRSELLRQIQTPPAAPSELSARLSGAQVHLAWRDNSDDEDGFEVSRSSDGGSFAVVGRTAADQTTLVDEDFGTASELRYRVLAFNGGGESGSTPPVSLLLPQPPLSPSELAVEQVGRSAVLSWRDNSNDEEGFAIQRSVGAAPFAPWVEVGPDEEGYVDATVEPRHRYRYRVAAFNSEGESAPSGEALLRVAPGFEVRKRRLSAEELAALSPCVVDPGATIACLQADRFHLTGSFWNDQQTTPRPVRFTVFAGRSVEVYFAGADNIEFVYRLLDGCALSDPPPAFWIFGGGASNQGFELRWIDLETGWLYQMYNDAGSVPPAVTDTAAFATCQGG